VKFATNFSVAALAGCAATSIIIIMTADIRTNSLTTPPFA
jgi:hypothetical protein